MVPDIEVLNKPKSNETSHATEKASNLRTLFDRFESHDASLALINFRKKETETSTYKQLSANIKQTAAQMLMQGIKKGDRVVFFAPNSPAWIVSALAVIYGGATVVPVDSQQSDEVLKHIIKDTDTGWIFTDDKGSKRLVKLLPSVKSSSKPRIVRLDTNDAESWIQLGQNGAEKSAPSSSRFPPVDATDIAVLFYTSGTTGMPKGVPLSHANMLLQIDSIAEINLLNPSDRILMPLPLFHVYPLNIGLLVPLSMGLPVILPHSLTGPEIIRSIKDGKATVLIGVPRLLRSLFKSIADRFNINPVLKTAFEMALGYCQTMDRLLNLRPGRVLFAPIRKKLGNTLRLFTCGGAPLDSELAGKLRALGWEIAVGYGLSETAPLLTLRVPQDRDLEGVGKPIKGVEVRIGKLTEPDEHIDKEAGEILARGANVFAGYLNRPDLNKDAFTEDGWFKTGDLGVFKHNDLHVIGRASSTIVMEGGEKIQPENVEDTLAKQPDIAEIGLLEVDHKLVALVVPDLKTIAGKDAKESVAAAIKTASADLASYLQITDFAITNDPLPRTNLGKIKRFELKARYESAHGSENGDQSGKSGSQTGEMESNDQTLVEEPAAAACLKWLKERFSDQQITMETSPQLDLNIDSLEWMNLTLEMVEKTGVELSGEAIGRVTTVRDLLKEIVASGEEGTEAVSPLEDPDYYLNDEQREFLKPLTASQAASARNGYHVILALMKPFRVIPVGLDRLTAKQYVFTPNHASYIDAFAIAAALPHDRLINTQWAGWSGIAFGNPIFSYLSRLARVFPIEAKRSLFASLALGVSVLKQGSNLVWFPEGERTLTGDLLPFKKGIGLLLEKSDIPVVPVYLDGTRAALPPGAFFPRFHQIKVVFGEPVKAEQLAKEGTGPDAPERIANALQSRVLALSKQRETSS
jgi:long-chain acyl-CoA synthetase